MDVLNLKQPPKKEELKPVLPESNLPSGGVGSQRRFFLEWQTEEFSYYEKSKTWFIFGGFLFFLVVGYFVIEKQITTSLTFLLLGLTIYIFSLKKPRNIKCRIENYQITADTSSYSYRDIESFWIFYEPPDFKVISLKLKKPYLPLIQIPLGDEDPIRIRKILLEFLHEEEQEESFSDRMARFLHF